LCIQSGTTPLAFTDAENIKLLQQRLNVAGQSIPGIPIDASTNLAARAAIETSSTLGVSQIPFDGCWTELKTAAAQLLPLAKDTKYTIEVLIDALRPTSLVAEFRTSSKIQNYTPDHLIEKKKIVLEAGEQRVKIDFTKTLGQDQYGFIIFRSNPDLRICCSEKRITGILSVFNKTNPAVNNFGKQTPPENSGFESFEFWCPERRPKGENIAMNITPALKCFSGKNLVNGYTRPYLQTNAWAADWHELNSKVTLTWNKPQKINSVTLHFDTDFDHPMESSQMGHPEDVIPFCVRNYKILDENGNLLYQKLNNYQTINKWEPIDNLETTSLCFEFEKPVANVPTSIFEIYID
jgi:hypothetical protein